MNEFVDYQGARSSRSYSSVPAVAFLGLGAAIAAANGGWPMPDTPTYTAAHARASYSILNDVAVFEFQPSQKSFLDKISSYYAALLANQEPLGAEFENLWNENAAELYE